jgi:hypothetical protein
LIGTTEQLLYAGLDILFGFGLQPIQPKLRVFPAQRLTSKRHTVTLQAGLRANDIAQIIDCV